MSDKSPKTLKCPVCKRATVWDDNPFRPFCGERCSIIDLGNWADNKYYIKSEPFPDDGEKETE